MVRQYLVVFLTATHTGCIVTPIEWSAPQLLAIRCPAGSLACSSLRA